MMANLCGSRLDMTGGRIGRSASGREPLELGWFRRNDHDLVPRERARRYAADFPAALFPSRGKDQR
jgi:hypothetical protein